MFVQLDCLWRARLNRHRVAPAQRLEHCDGVRPELDAGAYLAQPLGLLEHQDPRPAETACVHLAGSFIELVIKLLEGPNG
jgi:hypothetical protein